MSSLLLCQTTDASRGPIFYGSTSCGLGEIIFWSFIQSKVQETHAVPISLVSATWDQLLAVRAVTIIWVAGKQGSAQMRNEIGRRMEAMMKITELPPPRLANEAAPTQ